MKRTLTLTRGPLDAPAPVVAMNTKSDAPPARSRADHKRGPQAAGQADLSSVPAKRPTRTTVEDAERHLVNFHRHFAPAADNDLHFRTTRAVVVAARRWRKLANERLKGSGQTMARWETLFLVAFSDKDLTQSELAKRISVEGPTMVRMLDLLAQEGLIARQQSQADRRVTTNKITPQGTRVVGEIMQITNALRAEVLEDIDPEKLKICVDVLSQILKRLDDMR